MKDRYKAGTSSTSTSLLHQLTTLTTATTLTKEVYSLRLFLGIETGFTLDKESNTIAFICNDRTIVLSFDTREYLIQWQVRLDFVR